MGVLPQGLVTFFFDRDSHWPGTCKGGGASWLAVPEDSSSPGAHFCLPSAGIKVHHHTTPGLKKKKMDSRSPVQVLKFTRQAPSHLGCLPSP